MNKKFKNTTAVNRTSKGQGFCPHCCRAVTNDIVHDVTGDKLYCNKCQREIVLLWKVEHGVVIALGN